MTQKKDSQWIIGLIVGALTGIAGYYGTQTLHRNLQATRPRGRFGGFSRRTYHSFREVREELAYLLQHRAAIRRAMQLVDPAFQHRLMLAVTHVNGCRYCAHYHARLALQDGFSQDEVAELLGGEVTGCPAEEIPALRYAQHFAESNKHPEPAMRQQLVEIYGAERAQAIEIVIRMISLGNYSGNTFDYFLYRISGGKWGDRQTLIHTF